MNSKEIAKLELWIVTGCMILALLFSIIEKSFIPFHASFNESVVENGVSKFNLSIMGESFVPILFNYLIIYICYLFLCFHVSPELNKKEGTASKSVLFVFLLITAAMLLDIINIYWAILIALKILFILFTSNRSNKDNDCHYEAGFITSTWLLLVAALYLLSAHQYIKVYALLVVPIAILLYLFSIYHLIPKVFDKKWRFTRYFFRIFLLTALSCLIFAAIIGLSLAYQNDNFIGINTTFSSVSIRQFFMRNQGEQTLIFLLISNFFTQMIFTVPISWNTYKNRIAIKTEEIKALKTELGKSDANLNFLKSQINPHFLFNALNTIYGTALQEKAERTSEGIQKLGDMMRFMLQENMEDKILLSRDIDYLNNYIALQKLRISTSPDIIIETQIEDQTNNFQITPMLLIPFVENAFKHGISLQRPSHIKITLQVSDNKLYFDVHNSIHIKHENDPEKLQSGVGLQNVKQRLALLYPNHHELIIRENAKEFFIHLTLQLTEVNN